jgi:hypothetical protein
LGFITPLSFALLALMPVIVALYFLKLRREERTVSSVYLWQELVRDVAANAPWQRLRLNWLLFLQLLLLLALIVALARPFTWALAESGDHLILVIDTSASMAATDVAPNRLANATAQARHLIDALAPGVPVTLVVAGNETRIEISHSHNRHQLQDALSSLRPDPAGADMMSALELATALASGEPKAEIVILSDGGVNLPGRLSRDVALRYVSIGESTANQAVSALSLDPDGVGFVRVTNYDLYTAERRLLLYAYSSLPRTQDSQEHRLVAAHDLTIPGGESTGLTLPDLDSATIVLEAVLEGQDALGLDDQAWAVKPVLSGAQIEIVGPGNRFLEAALTLVPGVGVTTLSLEAYEAAWSAEGALDETENAIENGIENETRDELDRSAADQWLTVFDGVLPESGHYPPGALFFIGPLHSTEFFSVTGKISTPVPRPARANETLLQYVDLHDVVIQEAARLALPAWGRPVVVAAGEERAPLLITGELAGRRLAVLTFDLGRSDLPLQVAFPLLLSNLVDFLVPGTAGMVPARVAPGQAFSIPLPPPVDAVVVTHPDGARERLSVQDGEVLIKDTLQRGVYEVRWEAEGDQGTMGWFAVNVATPRESNIAPRKALELDQNEGSVVLSSQPTQVEWWNWLAWAGLILLSVEWLVQHRGTVTWLWNRTKAQTARMQKVRILR